MSVCNLFASEIMLNSIETWYAVSSANFLVDKYLAIVGVKRVYGYF